MAEDRPARPGPALVPLLVGLAALVGAGAALLDGAGVSPAFDLRWLLAGGAALLGLLLLVGSLRGRRRG